MVSKNNITIIAEIGKNFVDTQKEQPISVLLEKAKELIREAKKAGADTAKFQVHCVEDEIHPETKLISPHFSEDRYEWVKRNTYPIGFWHAVKSYCDEIGVEFLATPMSRAAAYLVEDFVDRWKIGSGDICDFVLLDYIRQFGKPVILSSGMSSLEELKLAYNFLKEKVEDITIMHCVSVYPCPMDKLNLNTIPFLKKEFPKAKIGFSDHSLSTNTGALAVYMGAEVIEKHFTLDRDAFGPDHKVSLLPDEFSKMVKKIKSAKSKEDFKPLLESTKEVLGTETKYIQEDEEKFRKVFRKGLFASQDVKKGEVWMDGMICALRPKGEALQSELYSALLNTIAVKDYKQHEAIK